ncbi:MAG TPA: nucleotide exchange factor GrpE [Candidatus Dormibacteraeota bacterium]|nr:nucleotide exchange factor GrpE [Candidatus Dormibacteraeota bacterium]
MSRRGDSEKEQEPRTDASASGAEAVANDSAPPETAAVPELEKLVAEKTDLRNALVRLQADFENYRKRIERERHQERHRGAETLVEHLLPVLDAFDRAISSHRDAAHDEYRQGFQLIRKQLFDVLAKQGVQRIETEGKPFDPHVHHAIERVETSDQPDGAVLEELQAGYSFHGKVLRPAMVRVAVNPEGGDLASNSSAN